MTSSIRTGSTLRPSVTQRANIKSFLQQGYSLTALEALSLFGAYRLAAHIEVLRKRGMNINTTMNKDVTGRTYARYSLDAEVPYLVPAGDLFSTVNNTQSELCPYASH